MVASIQERIVIENGLVEHQQVSTLRQVSLEDFTGGFSVPRPLTLPTLARSQRFAHYEEDDTHQRYFILTEIPAGIKTIIKHNKSFNTTKKYRLAMPYTYIWFMCEKGRNDGTQTGWSMPVYRCFHSRTPYLDVNTSFIAARISNVSLNGEICWGQTGVNVNLSLSDRLDTLTNTWYSSKFNNDLDRAHTYPLNYNGSYKPWVEATQRSATAWEEWEDWSSSNITKYTVAGLLSEHGVRRTDMVVDMPDAIPPIPMPFTFGSLDEWASQPEFTPARRAQLRAFFQNFVEETPPEVVVSTGTTTGVFDEDDGGEIWNG